VGRMARRRGMLAADRFGSAVSGRALKESPRSRLA
jgi:hypothetical protein